MSDMPIASAGNIPFRPRIQAHDWPGRASCAYRSLAWIPRMPGTPWLSVYVEDKGRLNYIDQKLLTRFGLSFDQVERLAVAAMVAKPAKWEVENAPGVLTCINDDFACERILDREFMRAGAARLRSSRGLAVAVPERGRLVATSFDDGIEFLAVAASLHARAENPPVSPWVFLVQDGLVTGRFYDENGEQGLDVVQPPTR